MNELAEYIIPFRGMKEGEHCFEFKVGNAFFNCFEGSEIHEGDLTIDVKFTNRSTFLIFELIISGEVKVPCDRCLEVFGHPVNEEHKFFVKFGEVFEEPSDDVVVIPHNETSIDISSFVYEYIMVSLPIQRMHESEDDCNSEITTRFTQGIVEEETQEIDPRWEQLKGLIK